MRLVEQWPEVRAAGRLIRPVIFLWSADKPTDGEGTPKVEFVDGVAVLYGSAECRAWREKVLAAGAQLSDSDVRALTSAALERLADGDAREAAGQQAVPSFQQLWWSTAGCLLTALAGFLVVLEPLSHRLYWLAAVVGVVGVGVGLLARRVSALRLPADAWLAAVVGVGLLAAVVLAFD